MKTKAKVINPEEIEVNVTITMPLCDWQLLCDQLDKKWPSAEFGTNIRSVIYQITQTFKAVEAGKE